MKSKNGSSADANKGRWDTHVAPRLVPASTIINPETDLLREYIDLISSSDNYAQAVVTFAEIDRAVLDAMKALVRTHREWGMPVSRRFSSMFRWEVNPNAFEVVMRQWLTVAPYASSGHSAQEGFNREKIVHTAYNLQSSWHGFEGHWNEGIAELARGCAIAACVIPDQQEIAKTLIREDAQWIGEHADAVFKLLPTLRERKLISRTGIEYLLATAVPLAAGAL